MKKIIWTAVIISILFSFKTVKAVSITKSSYIAKFKVVMKSNSSYWYSDYRFPYIYVDGKVAYCLQPNVSIITGSYSSSKEWAKYSQKQQQQIMLYTFYGHQYPGHQSRNYYLATQLLIWDIVGWKTTWYTLGGSKIDVSKQVNEIKALAARHDMKPSFADAVIELRKGEEIILKDSNDILSHYQIPENENLEISQEGNDLKIRLLNNLSGPLSITAQHLSGVNNGSPIIYTKSKSQKLLSAYIENANFYKLEIKQKKNSLKLHKLDRYGQSVEGAIFKIGDSSDLITAINYETDSAGYIYLEDLKAGNYYYQEVKAPNQYIIDPLVHSIEVLENEETTVELTNEVKKVDIKITKKDVETRDLLENAEFELYLSNEDEDPSLVGKAISDNKGEIYFQDLEYYQTYQICESCLPEGFEYINEQKCFSIRPSDNDYSSIVELEINNRRRKVKVQVSKQDINQDVGLNGAYFEVKEKTTDLNMGLYITGALYINDEPNIDYYVYSEDDYEEINDNSDTRKISYQLTTNADGEIIEYLPFGKYYLSKSELPIDMEIKDNNLVKTDEVIEGTFIIHDLKYGSKYSLCEIQAPTGYQLNGNSCMDFIAKADSEDEVMEISLVNNKLKIPYTGHSLVEIETGLYRCYL